ncbi:MAG: DUF2142 domain-containing protein [Actinomycetota bacterium]|nr:DUF2142 domain-containing protein [Actinomycetota bacterium]
MTPHRLLLLGWVLLSVAWVFGNPPFAAPDEGPHYLRTLAVAQGDLITEQRPEQVRGGTLRQRAWIRQLNHSARVPAGKAPAPYCNGHDSRADAACLDDFSPPRVRTEYTTQVGNYQPLPYLLPAAAMRVADSPSPALRWARAANALLTLLLLYMAQRMAWSPDAGAISLLGLVVAVTPMAIFCGAILNGTGPEIAAAAAFGAGMLRLRRDPSCARSPRVWFVIGASGVVLALSRSLGPAWIVLLALAALALVGLRPALGFLRAGGRAAPAALAAIGVAAGLNLLWEARHGPEEQTGFANLRAVLDQAVGEWWRASSELVGKFGYLEWRLPWWVYAGWFAAGFAVVAVALRAALRRERTTLAVTLAAALVLPMFLWVFAIRQTGFGLQGRHVFPALLAVPLVAGDLLRAHATALGERLRRALLLGVPLTAGLLHLVAWYLNARRHAVGTDGSLLFPFDAAWSPPLGWLPWLALATLGAAAIAATGYAAARTRAA